MLLYDSHHHLHDSRLDPVRDGLAALLRENHIVGGVVNATQESDWVDVIRFCDENTDHLIALGLHPWYLAARTSGWEERLRALLLQHPSAGIGEVGLDLWIQGHDIIDQSTVLLSHLKIACELNRPVTIHCVRAWPDLHRILKQAPLPARGILIHAYSGPPHLTPFFIECGAYFSFSTNFLHDRKKSQREAFRLLPAGRILIETDAPAMPPPTTANLYPLPDDLNHPLNLRLACRALAEIRGCSEEEIAELTSANHCRLFGGEPKSGGNRNTLPAGI